MVPFRMTRQIRNQMLPMKEKGLMEGVMIHTLHALRVNSEVLLSTMDVFIKEPSLDWKVSSPQNFANASTSNLCRFCVKIDFKVSHI